MEIKPKPVRRQPASALSANEDIDVQVMVLDYSILIAKMLHYLPRLILKAMYLQHNVTKALLRISRSLCGSSAQAPIFENQGQCQAWSPKMR